LSGGMRRRLLVAKAMVHSPKVLVLDEPTAGVDVDLRRHLWDYVRELNVQGATVLLTTHYLREAEELCDTIAIINHGRLIAYEGKEALLGRLDAKEMVLTLDRDIAAAPPQLAAFTTVLKSRRRIAVSYPPSRFNSGDVLAALGDAGLGIIDVVTREAELEDIFLNLTRSADGDETS
ncbi:MAG TPA: ABC transporter ATP-binding protein, partial [Alphaproteobacteria bacterium]|nr:ABC transporter ATP-binding protein [Alphaproteobacteria bacterium]